MNVKTGKPVIAGALVLIAGTTIAGAVACASAKEPEIVIVPGPTVTEHRVHQVPGPVVTKKVVVTETKTIRPQYPKKVTRSNGRWQPKPSTTLAPAPRGDARVIARSIFGAQYGCADALISRESGWNVTATNPNSGAYGLPQALPGYKMASAGSDWRTNPATQLRWMKSYVDSRYGGVCAAWNHWQSNHWY